MKKNTVLSFEEMCNREIESLRPDLERMESEIENDKEKFEKTEEEYERLTSYRKFLVDRIASREESIKQLYKTAKVTALWKVDLVLPWYKRIPKVQPGRVYLINLLKNMRDTMVVEEVKRRIAEHPDKTLTAIYEEMGSEARNYRKRCSSRTVRRCYENYLATNRNFEG